MSVYVCKYYVEFRIWSREEFFSLDKRNRILSMLGSFKGKELGKEIKGKGRKIFNIVCEFNKGNGRKDVNMCASLNGKRR